MDITRRLIECIKLNKAEEFLSIIYDSNNEVEIDYKRVDKALEGNSKFDIFAKLVYAYTFKRPMYGKLCKEVVNSAFSYSKDVLYFIATKNEGYRKRLLDILCFRIATDIEATRFINRLKLYGLYDEYYDSVVNGNNMALKIHYVLFIDYSSLDKMFTSPLDLAQNIVKCRALANMYMAKGDALLQLSKLTKDRDTILYIKNHLVQVVLSDRNRLVSMTQEFNDVVDTKEFNEDKTIKVEKDQQVLSYYKKRFESNTGININ